MLAAFAAALALVGAPPHPTALRPDQVTTLATALDTAAEHGLSRSRFVSPELERALASGQATHGPGERLLVGAVVRYARTVRSGRLPAAAFKSEWGRRPEPFDADGEFRRALDADQLQAWLAGLPPPSPAYKALQGALAHYRAIAARGGWPAIPAGPPARLGAQDARVGALRARLSLEAWPVEGTGDRFDPALAAALARFQASHGLAPTGTLDRATLTELNTSAETRIRQIEANLERLRWAERQPAPTRIEVNTAAQTLDYFEAGRRVLSMRTIVGKPATPTPMFDDVVEAVVFNPPWNVPPEIAAKEILPKARRDPGYLAREGFVILPRPGGSAARLQQRPGPKSALGLVKFDLPNRYNVYLHDTPARTLFARQVRLFSHGCIRLERPLDLARALLGPDLQWTPAATDAALAAGGTVRATLTRRVPVSIAYWTAFVDEEGVTQFRADRYRWDAELLARAPV